jgi:Spy/CpxP family protein refolding chaperone
MARKKNILAAVLALFTFAFAARAQQSGVPATPPSQTAPQAEQPQPNQDQLELMRSLNLTPEQRAQIAEIRRQTEEQSQQITQQLRRARRALDRAIYVENADEPTIQQRAKEVADAESARVKMRADAELKVRRVLTPEQFATFRELRRQTQIRQQQQRQNASGMVAQRPGARQTQRERTQSPPAALKNGNTQGSPPPLTPRERRQLQRNRRLFPRP